MNNVTKKEKVFWVVFAVVCVGTALYTKTFTPLLLIIILFASRLLVELCLKDEAKKINKQ